MLIGSPGTKKSSAIKIGVKLLKQAGYSTFAAKKTRQEKFLLDMAEQSERLAISSEGDAAGYDILDQNLWGDSAEDTADSYIHKPPSEVFIAADEFNTFIGIGNMDFISILGDLWDYEGVYDYRLKNSKSIFIPNPTISILGGNTATGFAAAFPPETIGQGFFSRLLLIYGEPSGVKYTFPPPPDIAMQEKLIDMLHKIKETMSGEVKMSANAMKLLHKIYHTETHMDDVRFEHYHNRRLTHLLKLCLVICASRLSTTIHVRDVLEANTLLTFTENLMPKALGEFGKSRNSSIVHTVMTTIDNAKGAITTQQIWKVVHQDLDNVQSLISMLGSLQVADKIQVIEGGGWLPKKKIREEGIDGAVDWDLLTKTERDMI